MPTILNNGTSIYYERQGNGPAMVLVHGYPLDRTIWTQVLPLLSDKVDLITPDQRGFGRSEPVSSFYSVHDMAGDIKSLLDHLQVEKAIIAGHSMGGYVALAFAESWPERVVGLALVASRVTNDNQTQKENRYSAVAQIEKEGVRPVATNMPSKLTKDEKLQADLTELIMKQSPLALIGAQQAMAERPDFSKSFGDFSFPIAMLAGIEDMIIPIEAQREMVKLNSGAKLFELENAAHMLMMESPQATAVALKSLI
jgi:3-oxoadipate enol-lactonase